MADESFPARDPELESGLTALFALNDVARIPDVVKVHPVLLTDRAIQALTAMELQHPDAAVRDHAKVYGTILNSSRTKDVNDVVSEFLGLRGLLENLAQRQDTPAAAARSASREGWLHRATSAIHRFAWQLTRRRRRPGQDIADSVAAWAKRIQDARGEERWNLAGAIKSTFAAYMTAGSWALAKRLVLAYPVLLVDGLDPLFAEDVKNLRDGTARQVAEQRLDVLRACRSQGIEPTFTEVARSMAEKALGLLQRRTEGFGHPLDLEAAIAGYTDAQDLQPSDDGLRFSLSINLAGALEERFRTVGDLGDIDRAIASYDVSASLVNEAEQRFDVLRRRGRAKYTLFHVSTNQQNLAGATADLDAAMQLSKSASQRARAGILLAAALLAQYTGSWTTSGVPDVALLKRIGKLCRDVLPDLTDAHDRVDGRVTYAAALLQAFLIDSGAAHLELAIAQLREAEQFVAPGTDEAIQAAAFLGDVNDFLYAATSNREVLDAALDARERAWAAVVQQLSVSPATYQVGIEDRATPIARGVVADYLERSSLPNTDGASDRRRALEIVIGAKSRLVMESVGRTALPSPPSVPDYLRLPERQWSRAMQRFRAEELTWRRSGGKPDDETRLARLREQEEIAFQLRALVNSIGSLSDPAAVAWAQLRKGVPISVDGLNSWLAQRSRSHLVVSLFLTPDIRARRESTTVLFASGSEISFDRIELGQEDWDAIWAAYVEQVQHFRPSQATESTWHLKLMPLLQLIGARLGTVSYVVLEPFGRAHLLPWAALARLTDWRSPGGEPIGVSVLPSLGLLASAGSMEARDAASAVVIGNDWDPELSSAEEARTVARHLGVEPVLGQDASWDKVARRLPSASVIHIATHARFEPASPLDSTIDLKDRAVTVTDLLNLDLTAELVALSACETGVGENIGGDEFAGFSTAFLVAGARRLLVTLWPVADWAARSFAETFYSNWIQDRSVERAFVAATVALHEDAVLSRHMRYWGAFSLVGVD